MQKLEQGGAPDDQNGTELEQLGLKLAPVKGGDGVSIMDVDPESDAAEKGLKAGDVIIEVGGSSVAGAADVAEGVKKAKELGRSAVMLYIKSADQRRVVALQLKKS